MSVRDGGAWGMDDAGVSGVEQASREELLALIGAQARMIEELTARVVELERRPGRDSSNSSQPPSQDGLGKPPARLMRGRSGRKPGKRPGAPGSALAQVKVPDRLVKHFPSACAGCAAPLDRAAVGDMVVRLGARRDCRRGRGRGVHADEAAEALLALAGHATEVSHRTPP
jgi:hypothetical protein